jgi:hypothetical protein
VVAVHQPNYLPWQGYFHKFAASDTFVFLDDAQYSKNSYINRTQMLSNGRARWLTVPVTVHLGDAINSVTAARPDWRAEHLRMLASYYWGTPHVAAVLSWIEAVFALIADDWLLARANRSLVEAVADMLGCARRTVAASEVSPCQAKGGDRLVELVHALAPGAVYLSGQGGAKYQQPEAFAAAGLELRYDVFDMPAYPQAAPSFVPGLSILDAVFSLGWEEASKLVLPAAAW